MLLSGLLNAIQVPGSSVATLDTPQYKVKLLHQQQSNGHGNGDTKLRALKAAQAFNRLEAAAAGIAEHRSGLIEPLSSTRAGASSASASRTPGSALTYTPRLARFPF